jgi:hypothetical protein
MVKMQVDDQPISSTFYHEGKWLSDFITPSALEVETLHDGLTEGIIDLDKRIANCWYWVAKQVKYKPFISGSMTIECKTSYQNDLWMEPSLTKKVKVGNCANKSFLLTSLIRRDLPSNQVYCVLGNLYNGKAGGHAWVQVKLNGEDYIVESTRSDIPVFVRADVAGRYEAIHFFNDETIFAVPGKTALQPFSRCYSTWLKDYLDWAYIEGER